MGGLRYPPGSVRICRGGCGSIWTSVEHFRLLSGRGWLGMSLFGPVVLPLKREQSNVGRSWHAWISPRGYGQTCSFLLIYSCEGGPNGSKTVHLLLSRFPS